MNGRPVSEDDLQAYVDQKLDPTRMETVEDYLADHPEAAERVAAYRRQRDALRDILGPIAEEPIPSRLNLARLTERHRAIFGRNFWREAVAAVLLLGIGLGGGWALHGLVPSHIEGVAALASEAGDTYAVFASDRVRPVEIPAADSRELVSWTSDRMRHPLTIPDLQTFGYRYMGGRIVATSHGPAVMLMYDDDDGTRLVMISRRMAADRNAAMSQTRTGNLTGFTWARDGIGYSLVGPVAPEALHPVANEIRSQLTENV